MNLTSDSKSSISTAPYLARVFALFSSVSFKCFYTKPFQCNASLGHVQYYAKYWHASDIFMKTIWFRAPDKVPKINFNRL